MKEKVYIRTFGCQMNERDSELIAGMLMEKGHEIVESPEEAKVILFNTCSVRQHAEDRV
ncbi:MAG: tRNA (N6-isopentenyl adenosine(37)-C2)-methylthiotransferase MiaB, partial [Candidatus Omnitrophica bacterium]|nr:tRNA (N6-isopentenyl adenosine(37)-C2)-methylthiotransferase MiaB [Candidatus Omnitrophota bacterium]